MKFKYLDHTSEAKFQAFGKTLEDAFANSALAMTNIMTDIDKVEKKKKKEIKISSNNLKALLYDFLDEIIYITDVDLVFISGFENLKIDDKEFTLTGIAVGDDISNCPRGGEVKAPTYDEMLIENKDKWMIQVVVDV